MARHPGDRRGVCAGDRSLSSAGALPSSWRVLLRCESDQPAADRVVEIAAASAVRAGVCHPLEAYRGRPSAAAARLRPDAFQVADVRPFAGRHLAAGFPASRARHAHAAAVPGLQSGEALPRRDRNRNTDNVSILRDRIAGRLYRQHSWAGASFGCEL